MERRMNREEALQLIKSKNSNENLIKHMLSVEAVMRSLAERFNEDKDKWGLAGLLHDVDYEETSDDFTKHGIIGAKLLREKGVEEDVVKAVEAHVGRVPRHTNMEKAIYAADPLTGLIIAAALMHPSRQLRQLQPKSVKKRFKDKRFAAGANREQIQTCEELGLSLDEFIEISIDAMRGISEELGL